MFNPSKAAKDKAEKQAKQKAINDLRTWSLQLVPEDLKPGLIIDINEVVCGDPSCAPIDTVFTLVWEPKGKGLFSIAAPPIEISAEELQEEFPVSLYFIFVVFNFLNFYFIYLFYFILLLQSKGSRNFRIMESR
jgi:hypothetical protein